MRFSHLVACFRELLHNRISLPTHDSWFEIDEDCSGYVLPGAGFAEEGIEAVITAPEYLV